MHSMLECFVLCAAWQSKVDIENPLCMNGCSSSEHPTVEVVTQLSLCRRTGWWEQ